MENNKALLWLVLWFLFIGSIANCNAQSTPMHEAAIEIAESSVKITQAIPTPVYYTYNPTQVYTYTVPVIQTLPAQSYYMYNTDGTFTTFTIQYVPMVVAPYVPVIPNVQ